MSVVDINPTLDGSLQRALDTVARDAGRVLRLCPGPNGHGYPLLDWILSPLPETCERENLGLAVDYQGADIPWDDVVRFARAYPALPIILVGASSEAAGVAAAARNVAPNLIFMDAPDGTEAAAWREAHL